MAVSRFQTCRPSSSHECSIGFKSGDKLGHGRLVMFYGFCVYSMTRARLGLTLLSWNTVTMFWLSGEFKEGITSDCKISSRYF